MAQIEKKDGEEKKFPKKLIIIIAVAVLLLAASGGAAFYFFKGDASQSESEKTAHEDENIPKEELYFDMSKSLIVDFSKESAVRLIQVSVSFLVGGAETVDALKKHEPMIRNNLLMMISAQGAESLKTHEGKEQLRGAMLREVNEILKKMAGKGQVKEVFFTSFVMQ